MRCRTAPLPVSPRGSLSVVAAHHGEAGRIAPLAVVCGCYTASVSRPPYAMSAYMTMTAMKM